MTVVSFTNGFKIFVAWFPSTWRGNEIYLYEVHFTESLTIDANDTD